MPLKVIATPIGNPGDITLRARDALLEAEIVIGEERKEVSKLLKSLGRTAVEIYLLNEHSKDADVAELLELCRNKNVALVSDAGTPGFCDPGARLVEACRKANIAVTGLPGASSLMCLLSVCGTRLDQFVFRGFLPADREARPQAVREIVRDSRAVAILDTPYRLGKLLAELSAVAPKRKALLGLDLTQETEEIIEAPLETLAQKFTERKAEFVLLLLPETKPVSPQQASPGIRKPQPSRRPRD